ncbi:MAG: phenylalanine--tRNA ligase subunit alpha, partial [Clostridia bacterium]|nr:phenylalanine--tRNA ligase subunit alpha [Clostridia bacterium]
MFDELKNIREQALTELESIISGEELEKLSASVLGRGGKLTAILRTMGQLSAEERAALGQRANVVKQELTQKFDERKAALLELAEQKRIEREAIDVTMPGVKRAVPMGALNPLTLVYREIRDALVGLGFTTFEGPEVEYDEYNFTLLNLPPNHPARDMQDTFYVNDKVLLRTHTSPCEARALKTLEPPFRLVIPGRVFRVDEPDASHSPVFMQMEGLVVDKDATLADLKGTIDSFVKAV